MSSSGYGYKTADVSMGEHGVLTVRLHSRGDSLAWTALPHRELPALFAEIAKDRDVRVVVLTGAGAAFIRNDKSFEGPIAKGIATAAQMDEGLHEGNRLLDNLLGIEVPIIAAVNGPVDVHSELALLSDIVLCTEDTYFQDAAHVPGGLVPGDGIQVVWTMLLGPNRGRYFLLTGERIAAAEALRLGVVGEVLVSDNLMARAYEHAHRLAVCNPVFVRNTRHVLVRPLRRAIAQELQTGLALEAVASLSGAQWNGPFEPLEI